MPPYVRTTIQIAVAGTLAVVAGDAISGRRLYWSVLAVFLCFIAASNSGEQVRRALFRAGGTAIGIVLGDLLVHLTGGQLWSSLLIVLVALFFGIYLIRVNYMFMTMGITVTMAQLYVQLDEFSWSAAAAAAGRDGDRRGRGRGERAAHRAAAPPAGPDHRGAALVHRAAGALEAVLDGSRGAPAAAPLVRDVDAAYAALEATAMPLRRATFGRNSAQLTELLSVGAAARQYVRALAAGWRPPRRTPRTGAAGAGGDFWAHSRPLADAAAQLRRRMAAVEHRIRTGEHGCYVRSSALVALALDELRPGQAPLRHALRDLTLLDGTLARLAAALQMDVADHDTGPAAPQPGRSRCRSG